LNPLRNPLEDSVGHYARSTIAIMRRIRRPLVSEILTPLTVDRILIPRGLGSYSMQIQAAHLPWGAIK
jgi:hypothetical protein